MNMSQLMEKIPEFGRDIKLNLDSILGSTETAILGSTETASLSPTQRASIALACAYAVDDREIRVALLEHFREALTPEIVHAAKGAASIMAMNNVYYRFLHLAEEPELKKLPARLRMNLIAKPGIEKIDFELMCLAVSALAGCGSCIQSHIQEVKKGGVSLEGIQAAARIASVIQATHRVLDMSDARQS